MAQPRRHFEPLLFPRLTCLVIGGTFDMCHELVGMIEEQWHILHHLFIIFIQHRLLYLAAITIVNQFRHGVLILTLGLDVDIILDGEHINHFLLKLGQIFH